LLRSNQQTGKIVPIETLKNEGDATISNLITG